MSAEELPIFSMLGPREDLTAAFYHLLWEKAPATKAGVGHTLGGVHIPDTVLLNHSRALHWYFTSKEGQVLMKGKARLNSKTILEQFAPKGKQPPQHFVAQLSRRVPTPAGEVLEVTPHTLAELRVLLSDGATTGALQRFVYPKRENHLAHIRNCVTVAQWTPNVLHLERKVNGLPLDQERYTVAERTTLDESSHHVQCASLVSQHTTLQLERACSLVAAHVEAIHGCKVTNLVLHFKVDDANVPWIIHCETVRVSQVVAGVARSISLDVTGPAGSTQAVGAKSAASRAATGSDSSHATAPAADELTEQCHCELCEEEVPRSGTTLVARRHVLLPLNITHFFSTQAPGTPFTEDLGDGRVPYGYDLLRPGITAADFQALRGDARWQDHRLRLCDGCAEGLHAIMANVQIDKFGAMKVPRNYPGREAVQRTVGLSNSGAEGSLPPL